MTIEEIAQAACAAGWEVRVERNRVTLVREDFPAPYPLCAVESQDETDLSDYTPAALAREIEGLRAVLRMRQAWRE